MGSKRNIIQRIREMRLNIAGHYCIMEDSRLVKEVVFGEMEEKTKREWHGRHNRNGVTRKYTF